MKNPFWGEMIFHAGWKVDINIVFYGKKHSITLKAKAYREEDGITAEQDRALSEFAAHKDDILETAEKLLDNISDGSGAEYFTPRTLLFERDGSYALLCDDRMDEDDGVAVLLSPEQTVVFQNEYL